ncbi:hypothetical protein K2173_024486 [Erythroxylum novogranatense]|uniref:ENT domain-containing protein n=1 Tax=Erythroxylum novogranatense TaxID=1862640 RepID=A0AAV8SVB2_9ROSI|nr:hypothetical protein K2173_024486 [Erythroxylum novogranatense]
MMRFRKGTKVEVLSDKEVSIGSWLCGEIISGNGRTYCVKYAGFGEAKEERVPRKVLRPCPPHVDGEIKWACGDLVEVFHNFCWKTARVIQIMDGDYFVVRLLGNFMGLRVPRSYLRVRQCWQNGKWLLVGEGARNCGMPVTKPQVNTRMNQQIGDECMVPSTASKRRSPIDEFEVHQISAKRMQTMENVSSYRRICSARPSQALDEVEADHLDELYGENYRNSPRYSRITELSRVNLGRENHSRLLEPAISVDSCKSSVGSCSVVGYTYKFPVNSLPLHDGSTGDYCSDAESSCCPKIKDEESSLFSPKELELGSRRTDFHGYCSTIRQLYSSGPLSWEDEAKLTNLRQVLCISDDEHLKMDESLLASVEHGNFSRMLSNLGEVSWMLPKLGISTKMLKSKLGSTLGNQ